MCDNIKYLIFNNLVDVVKKFNKIVEKFNENIVHVTFNILY